MKWSEIDKTTASVIAATSLITFGYLVYRLRQPARLNTDQSKANISFASQQLVFLAPVKFKTAIAPANAIIFVHPPKVGGTNLTFVADALSKADPDFKAIRFAVPRVPGQSPGKIYTNWTGGLKAAQTKLKTEPDCCKDMNFVSGHFPFGAHKMLGLQAKYVVLVRNPVEREISNTNFDFQRGYLTRDQAKEYLLNANIDNPQTRMLAGVDYMSGVCTTDVLETAKRNIEQHFLLAGITEDTNTFIQVLASIQDWGPLALTRSQVTGDKVFTKIDPEFQQLLAHKHSFDMQLYAWVKNRWLEWKQQNIDTTAPIEPLSKKALCILPEYAHDRTPIFMNLIEIANYNQKVRGGLIQVSQNHIGLKSEDRTIAAYTSKPS
ncbi:MAG TPA: hypothetical protein VLG38_08145 [Gammaproteobacteria bacterium]|nr:hypothetical protein [Gammaproteobacteria bacterium]